jgi:hypothetical protein
MFSPRENSKKRAAELLPVQPLSLRRAWRQPEPAPKVVTFGIHRTGIFTDSLQPVVGLQPTAMQFPNKSRVKIFKNFLSTENLSVPVKLSVEGVKS